MVADLWTRARLASNISATLDAVFGPTLNCSVLDPARSVLRNNSSIMTHPSTQGLGNAINNDGSLDVNLEDVKGQYAAALETLSRTVAGSTKTLHDYSQNQQTTDVWQAQKNIATATSDFNATRALLTDASGAVNLTGKIIGAFDPTAGSDFAKVGNSVIQVATAINDYGSNVDKLYSAFGDFGTIIGTAALANTVVGAVFSIAGVFGDSNAAELQQLAAMRNSIDRVHKDIVSLSQEMSRSFAIVDAKLDTAIALIG